MDPVSCERIAFEDHIGRGRLPVAWRSSCPWVFLEEQAASVTATLFHIYPTGPDVEDIWVKMVLLAAFHPGVVVPFDNVDVKDRALAQLQHSSRVNFLEEKGVQLDAYAFRGGTAMEPNSMLGSGPLKSLALRGESSRAFLWYKDYIFESRPRY